MANSVGIIDCDFYGNPDNDGALCMRFIISLIKDLEIKKGDVIGQAIFQKYYISDDDNAEGTRTGGFGFTTND